MTHYSTQLTALHQAVVAGKIAEATPYVKQSDMRGASPESRLAVYADGYVERLVGVVTADYPATQHLIGHDAFDAAARQFIADTPSMQWDLNLYSVGFSEHFAQHHEAADAADIARLESAIVHGFWAQGSQALNPHTIAELAPEQLIEHHFTTRTALTLLTLDYAANDYLTAFRAGNPPEAMRKETQYLCILRHHHEVKRLLCKKEAFILLTTLRAQHTLAKAFDELASDESIDLPSLTTSLPHTLQDWLENGVFAD